VPVLPVDPDPVVNTAVTSWLTPNQYVTPFDTVTGVPNVQVLFPVTGFTMFVADPSIAAGLPVVMSEEKIVHFRLPVNPVFTLMMIVPTVPLKAAANGVYLAFAVTSLPVPNGARVFVAGFGATENCVCVVVLGIRA
jgi:hypothetical protein